jgi:hypothetical protein
VSGPNQRWVANWSPYSGHVRLVHERIAYHAWADNGNLVWVNVDALASEARTSVRTVRRAFAMMIRDGYLEIASKPGGRAGGAIVHRALFPDPQQTLDLGESVTVCPESVPNDAPKPSRAVLLHKGKKAATTSNGQKTEPPSYPRLSIVIADPLPAEVVANGFAAAREAMGR